MGIWGGRPRLAFPGVPGPSLARRSLVICGVAVKKQDVGGDHKQVPPLDPR